MDIYDKVYDGNCGISPYRSEVVEKSDGVGFDRETREFRKTEMKFKKDVFLCLRENKRRCLNRFKKLSKADDEEDDDIDFLPILWAFLAWIPTIAQEARSLALRSLETAYGRSIPQHILDAVRNGNLEVLENHARNMVARAEDYTKRKVAEMEQKALANGDSDDQYETTLNESHLFSMQRASTISSTELFTASVAASDAIFRTAGMMTKKWNVYPGCCNVCADNAAVGWINVNQAFPDGSFRPPLHPNCRCDVKYKAMPNIGSATDAAVITSVTTDDFPQEE